MDAAIAFPLLIRIALAYLINRQTGGPRTGNRILCQIFRDDSCDCPLYLHVFGHTFKDKVRLPDAVIQH